MSGRSILTIDRAWKAWMCAADMEVGDASEAVRGMEVHGKVR
jgi:hypothetical protein